MLVWSSPTILVCSLHLFDMVMYVQLNYKTKIFVLRWSLTSILIMSYSYAPPPPPLVFGIGAAIQAEVVGASAMGRNFVV